MQARIVSAVLILIFFAACTDNGGHRALMEMSKAADSVAFASDITDLNSPSRKMMRTADLRCRVTDVFAATTKLEQLVESMDGLVEQSDMSNDVSAVRNVAYKADSLKQTQTYTTTALLRLRVPTEHMDSILQAIPSLTVFTDHRNVRQTDLTLHYLSNALKNDAAATPATVRAIQKPATKVQDAIAADEYLGQQSEVQTDRRIQNMRILDDVNYATVTVAFYQPERVSTAVIINPEYFTRPSAGMQLQLALGEGWQMTTALFIFLARLWPFWILILAGYEVYRIYKRRWTAGWTLKK